MKTNKRGMNKSGQVWVETVIYTLIAFALIGAVLGFAKPKIEEIQDKAIIEQTIQMMEDINSQIETVKEVQGNKRLIELGIKKGQLIINGVDDKLVFELESRHTYTEPGEDVSIGSLTANTQKRGKFNLVTLTSEYGDFYDIRFDDKDQEKIINPAAVPHKLFIYNSGKITFIDEDTGCLTDSECVSPPDGFEEYTSQCIAGAGALDPSDCKYTSTKIKLDFSLG